MKQTSAELLEFEPLRAVIGRYTGSPMGHSALAEVQPASDRAFLEDTFAALEEAIAYLKAAAQPQPAQRGAAVRLRFTGLPDCRQAAQKIRIEGASLEGRELHELLTLLDRAGDVRGILQAVSGRFPRLGALGSAIGDFRSLVHDYAGRIQPDGTLADHASVSLNRLRRAIEKQRRDIQDSLERFLRQHRADGTLQEEFVTLRNDRFVVPVVLGAQKKVEGVVHGSSGSGHTLFVEPLETIELNNELVRLTEEELREVHRILREMTERLRGYAAPIQRTIETLGELDLLFAKAQFALEFDAVIPRFSPDDKPRLYLDRARHPLLEDVLRRQKKQVVPVSLELSGATRTLLISGPNTGGKTVTLKTAGLLTLMAHAGLPTPCAEAEFPLFEQVLADVGDKQSIEESLSSFSAHIQRIRELVELVTPDSLMLLDELGRATDPEEGGALGVAVLDRFREVGAFTLASTHLRPIKIYGGATPGVLNGSMGFDRDTLQPTYRLRLGAPGESAGLDIASRLGLPAELIARARAAMATREREMSDFLAELERQVDANAAAVRSLDEQKRALAAREQAVSKEWSQRETAKLGEIERRAELLLRRFEEQARETIEQILGGAQQRKAAEQALRKVARTAREFREELRTTVLSTSGEARQGQLAPLRIQEGVRVRLKDLREPARVRRKLSDGRIEVEAGFLKLQVPVEDVLEVLPDAPSEAKLPRNVTFQPAGPRWDVSFREINLIGQRAEEAIEAVDRFLDQAVMAGANRARIVHGHGMGVLKKAVAETLAKSPHVEKYYPAPPSEGGTGATIVELKEN